MSTLPSIMWHLFLLLFLLPHHLRAESNAESKPDAQLVLNDVNAGFPNFPPTPHPQFAPTPVGHVGPAVVPAPPPGYSHSTPTLAGETVTVEQTPVNTFDKTRPQFHYKYGVSDPVTGDQKTHTETRDGDVVKGEYSFVDSDGSIRIVTYTADSIHGFQAVVKTIPAHANTVPVADIAHAPVLPYPVPDYLPHNPALDVSAGTPTPLVAPVPIVAIGGPHPAPHHRLPPPHPFIADVPAIPDVLTRIPGLDPAHLTEADLLLANPETHTHPYGSHPLLPIHPGHDTPHSHPPFNDPPVIDLHALNEIHDVHPRDPHHGAPPHQETFFPTPHPHHPPTHPPPHPHHPPTHPPPHPHHPPTHPPPHPHHPPTHSPPHPHHPPTPYADVVHVAHHGTSPPLPVPHPSPVHLPPYHPPTPHPDVHHPPTAITHSLSPHPPSPYGPTPLPHHGPTHGPHYGPTPLPPHHGPSPHPHHGPTPPAPYHPSPSPYPNTFHPDVHHLPPAPPTSLPHYPLPHHPTYESLHAPKPHYPPPPPQEPYGYSPAPYGHNQYAPHHPHPEPEYSPYQPEQEQPPVYYPADYTSHITLAPHLDEHGLAAVSHGLPDRPPPYGAYPPHPPPPAYPSPYSPHHFRS